MDYGKNLYELRKQKSLSQEEVANELGVSRQSVSLWETSQASPSMDNLIALARLYEVSLDELVGLNDATTKRVYQEEPKFQITYKEDKKTIYRRDYTYLNTTSDLVLFFLSLFFFILALSLFLRAPSVIIEVAKALIIIGNICVIIGLLIYPLYIFINIKQKLKNQNTINIEFYNEYINYKLNKLKEDFIRYEMIYYYIEKKDYYIVYLIKSNRIYIPKQNNLEFNEFLSKKIERRKRKKPYWKHL